MRKKELVWRLKEKPTVNEVTELVSQNIIDKEEARQILFNMNEAVSDATKIKALKEQVEFLEGVIERLSKNSSPWTFTYSYNYPTTLWYRSGASGSSHVYTAGTGNTLSVNSSNLIG